MNTETGKVLRVIEESGTSAKGAWNKTTVVLDNGGQFNNTVPFQFFKKTASELGVREGDEVSIDFYTGGREYQGRYYAEYSGQSLKVNGAQSAPQPTAAQQAHVPNVPKPTEVVSDGLPF